VNRVRNRAAADVVGAREADAVAHDVGKQRRIEPGAIEHAKHQREVGAFRIPGRLELIAQRDPRRGMRAAHRDLPFAAGGRRLAACGEGGAQLPARLFERQPPVVEHEARLRAAHPAGDVIEGDVFIGCSRAMAIAGSATPAAKMSASAASAGRANRAVWLAIHWRSTLPASPPATASGGSTNTKCRTPLYIAGRSITVTAIGRTAANAMAKHHGAQAWRVALRGTRANSANSARRRP
jgi:hypothetical protein